MRTNRASVQLRTLRHGRILATKNPFRESAGLFIWEFKTEGGAKTVLSNSKLTERGETWASYPTRHFRFSSLCFMEQRV